MKEKRTKTDESPLDSCKPKRELLINTHGSVCGRRQSLFAPCTSTSYSYSNKKLHTNALYLTLNSLRETEILTSKQHRFIISVYITNMGWVCLQARGLFELFSILIVL